MVFEQCLATGSCVKSKYRRGLSTHPCEVPVFRVNVELPIFTSWSLLVRKSNIQLHRWVSGPKASSLMMSLARMTTLNAELLWTNSIHISYALERNQTFTSSSNNVTTCGVKLILVSCCGHKILRIAYFKAAKSLQAEVKFLSEKWWTAAAAPTSLYFFYFILFCSLFHFFSILLTYLPDDCAILM